MVSKKIASIAKSKMQRFQRGYCAYLTPVEAMYLHSIGCVFQRSDMEEMCTVSIQNGHMWASWIYFSKATFPVDKVWS